MPAPPDDDASASGVPVTSPTTPFHMNSQRTSLTALSIKDLSFFIKSLDKKTQRNLMEIACKGNTEFDVKVVKHCLKLGVSLSSRTFFGNTILHDMFETGRCELKDEEVKKKIVRLLLDAGFKQSPDETRFYPIDMANSLGYFDIAKILKAYGGQHSYPLHPCLKKWFADSTDYTKLCFVEQITAKRALLLMRNGEDVDFAANLVSTKSLKNKKVADLIMLASKRWHPNNHHTFDVDNRTFAKNAFFFSLLLARQIHHSLKDIVTITLIPNYCNRKNYW